MTEQEYLQQIHELEKQVLRLQTELKKNSETQYGLRWMDVPEAFEAEAENAIPTLEEVPGKAISNDDGKPTHILIEGDNFHALTCLNYTHKGQIDVIYIDPPYNTGSDGFVYKDKRVLDKFPDGTTVPTDHPLRHSYWLSFMHKRLELAKNLLSDRGVIFISIDDNEQANLKLLCDQVFGQRNFLNQFIWINKPEGRQIQGAGAAGTHEYILSYARDINNLSEYTLSLSLLKKIMPGFYKDNSTNVKYDPKGAYITTHELYNGNSKFNEETRPTLVFDIYYRENDGNILIEPVSEEYLHNDYYKISPHPNSDGKHKYHAYRWSKEKILNEKDDLEFVKSGNTYKIYSKRRDFDTTIVRDIITDISTSNGSRDLERLEIKGFSYPKSVDLISLLINMATIKSSEDTDRENTLDATILDFFGGSGTTMHATMQLNEEDGGHRQCILVQQNENNICEAVTYERNKRVMQGYMNSKKEYVPGLGNSMKYYRTAFVGEHKITDFTDADKVALTQKAGCLLALGENTLEEIKTAKSYQIFQLRKGDKPTNDFGYTAVYFSGNLLQFADFRREIEQIQAANPLTRIAVYVFTWGDPSVFENEFDDLSGITIKPIPQPILEIYQNIHQL